MKYMSMMIFLVLSYSLNSMDLVPFLKKEERKEHLMLYVITLFPKQARNITVSYLAKLLKNDTKETTKMCHYPCKINFNENRYEVAKGAAAGTCAGFGCGTIGISTYGMIDSCIWCWSNIAITKLTCNMMMCGLLTCGCAGCMTGSCCIMAGYIK
jgi:hypothetical protein